MKDFGEALALVLEGIEPVASERVALHDAIGRVISAEACAAIDLPPFDRTAMDGYAVRAADVSPGAELRVIGDLAAGGSMLALSPGPPRGSRPAPRFRPAPTPSCASRMPSCATRPSSPAPPCASGCTCAAARRTCTRATCSPAPATS